MAPHDERRPELQLLRKAQEQRSRSDRRGRRIHQRELPRHQRQSPDPLAIHQPADPNARRTAATFAAGLWHGHSTVAEHTETNSAKSPSCQQLLPAWPLPSPVGFGRKVAEFGATSATCNAPSADSNHESNQRRGRCPTPFSDPPSEVPGFSVHWHRPILTVPNQGTSRG